MKRKILSEVKGFETTDGAGVRLMRVLSRRSSKAFDPILMLDSFDSTDPKDYIAGFPMHPHRGIETISYVYKGNMLHKDSLGNQDAITDGELQWMTAGSGILHSEEIPVSERMLGVQLWLNLPAKDKMVAPEYHAIKNKDIEEIEIDGGKLRLLAGNYKGNKGYQSKHLPLNYYDIQLAPNKSFKIETEKDSSLLLFTLVGKALIDDKTIEEKTAVKLGDGDEIVVSSLYEDLQLLFVESKYLGEPISWGGPIVMNTKEELDRAFEELENGNFIKDEMIYD
ncbi:MAG: pirin family protein [Peptostreptococcus sp.]|uniref:pirin family protein n=1 Tax=Peptostreptococcus sp. TaxID=1262 RepID=UPI002FC5BAEF